MDFWLIGLGLGLIEALILAVIAFLVMPSLSEKLTLPVVVLAGIVRLAFLWPVSAVGVRRSHDRNMSGWWYAAYAIVGVGLELWGQLPLSRTLVIGDKPIDVVHTLETGNGAVGLIFLVILGFLPGTPGTNRFGPSPHNRQRNYRPPIMDSPDEFPQADEAPSLR